MTQMALPRPTGPSRRRHLFEFEDLRWFPRLFRDTITSWLADAFVGVYAPAVPLVLRLLDSTGSDRVVDLCSGGTGPWEYLKRQLDEARTAQGRPAVTLTLTDRFPNVPAFTAAAARLGPDVEIRSASVDARHVPADLRGVRTLFTSFHHLDVADARAVLADAARSGAAIGVFDFTQRDWQVIRNVFWQVPLSMLRTVRTWQPRHRARLFFTYVAPLIVLTSLWDAVVSQLRAYRPAELLALTEGLGGDGYRWEVGELRTSDAPAADVITYVLGHPVSPASPAG